MVLKVKLSRLLRKKTLDSTNRCSPTTRSQSRILFNAVLQTANPSLVVGYFITFSYSVSLAPTTLLAAVFVASIASLLSELCRYEFLTCRRNTSPCPYICTYQILGEIAAHLYGWTQLLNRGASAALVARGIGSTLFFIFGKRLLRHNILPPQLVHEDSIAVTAQILVSSFVLLGLKMTTHFTAAIKLLVLVAILLFISETTSFNSSSSDEHHQLTQKNIPSKEELLMSAALLSIAFKPENKESQILSKSSLMSAFLGIQYCCTLFLLVVMSIVFCFLPTSTFNNITSGSPLLEILLNIMKGPHWSAAIFSCCCILVGCLSLVEAIQDSKRHIIKMSSDGLILKQIATDSKLALFVHCLISIVLQLTMSTLNLVFIISFINLCLDSILGIVITYRRYCSSSRQLQQKNVSKQSTGYDVLGRQLDESDSDDTDIDAVVDDYKNQMYVSTVMQWNGSDIVNQNCTDNGRGVSAKLSYFLLSATIVILVMSLAMRWISNLNSLSLSISMLSFVIYNLILFIIWTHPQRHTSSNPTLKVPCVPWIPIGSTLFNCIMLFQLPTQSWVTFFVWVLIGITVYVCYGYKSSRLNFRVHHNVTEKKFNTLLKKQKKMQIIPENLLNVTSSSIAVYPQPYYNI